MEFIQNKSHEASQELALKRGAFPNFSDSIYSDLKPIRNATTTTIAPTGTIGIIACASGGIEPIFALVYKREHCLDNEEMYEINPYFESIAKKEGFYSKELMDKISRHATVRDFKEIPKEIRKVFVTAHDISPEEHIKMQAAFQKWTDNAVSKTVNFPNSAVKEDVKKVYMLSYKTGCKGVTVYRDGSRKFQVLNIANKKEEKSEDMAEKKRPRKRPKKTTGFTFLMNTGCGRMYVTINEDDKGPCELFTQLGKSGACTSSQAEAIARLVSISLRSGIDQKSIIMQLKGIRCPNPILAEGGAILSCADAIAKALEAYDREKSVPALELENEKIAANDSHNTRPLYLDNNKSIKDSDENFSGGNPQCPDCGAMLTFSEGCSKCPSPSCGYSKCW
jgi:ribonucleoside-diphosphate reductase alpha chain